MGASVSRTGCSSTVPGPWIRRNVASMGNPSSAPARLHSRKGLQFSYCHKRHALH
jgi:hypothetical protein